MSFVFSVMFQLYVHRYESNEKEKQLLKNVGMKPIKMGVGGGPEAPAFTK